MLDANSDEQIILQKGKAGTIIFMKMKIKKNRRQGGEKNKS